MVPNVQPALQTVRRPHNNAKCHQLEKVRRSFGTSFGLLLRSRTVKRVVVVRVFDQKFGGCAAKARLGISTLCPETRCDNG